MPGKEVCVDLGLTEGVEVPVLGRNVGVWVSVTVCALIVGDWVAVEVFIAVVGGVYVDLGVSGVIEGMLVVTVLTSVMNEQADISSKIVAVKINFVLGGICMNTSPKF